MSAPREELEGSVIALITEQLGLTDAPERVQLRADLFVDLGADSLDLVEMVMAIEEDFDLVIPDPIAEAWKTPADIIEYLGGLA